MRNALFTAEQQLFLSEAQKYFLERETSELKEYIASHRPRYLPNYVEDFAPDPNFPEFDEMAIEEANCVFKKPLSFYGGYVMEKMHKKDEVLAQEIVHRLLSVITKLQEEKKLMQIDREAVNNVAILNFDLAQNDADRIKGQADEIAALTRLIDLNNKMVGQEKTQLYRDMKAKYEKLENEYAKYRSFAQTEIEVAHAVIEK